MAQRGAIHRSSLRWIIIAFLMLSLALSVGRNFRNSFAGMQSWTSGSESVIIPIVPNITDDHDDAFERSFPQISIAEQFTPKLQDKKVLVVYSGPTDLPTYPNGIKRGKRKSKGTTRKEAKTELYRLNFEFFLLHGIQCQWHDTLLVVTESVAQHYQSQIDTLHSQCNAEHDHYVRLVIRNNTCLDLESVRVALQYAETIGRAAVIPKSNPRSSVSVYYDYFVYANCGVTGPSPRWAKVPWINAFLQGLTDQVKMTGLSLNCYAFQREHVQSMMFALDRIGLQVVMDGGAIFDCREHPIYKRGSTFQEMQTMVIVLYELGMSQILMKAGYGISSVSLRPTTLFAHNRSLCLNKEGNHSQQDLWLSNTLVHYFGKIPSLDDVIFFKTSRVLTPETATLINFAGTVNWNW